MPEWMKIDPARKNLQFRQLNASDVEIMLKFHKANLIVPADEAYMEKMTIHPNWSLGAFDGKTFELVASILIERSPPHHKHFKNQSEQSFAYVSQLAVASTHRNQGIAKILLGALENPKVYPFASQTTAVCLHVMAQNIAAIHLYKNCGFVSMVFVPNMYSDDSDGFEMVKPLFPVEADGGEKSKKVGGLKCCFGWFSLL